eukprot:3295074-Prymnesium_polylepis.2
MSCAWVPSISVALVGPHASMLDYVRQSDRVFCVCNLTTLDACYPPRWVPPDRSHDARCDARTTR